MKRKLSLLLALVMVFTLIPVQSHAATLNIMDNPKLVTPDTTIELTDNLKLQIGKDSTNKYQGVQPGDEFQLTLEGDPEWKIGNGTIDADGNIIGDTPSGGASNLIDLKIKMEQAKADYEAAILANATANGKKVTALATLRTDATTVLDGAMAATSGPLDTELVKISGTDATSVKDEIDKISKLTVPYADTTVSSPSGRKITEVMTLDDYNALFNTESLTQTLNLAKEKQTAANALLTAYTNVAGGTDTEVEIQTKKDQVQNALQLTEEAISLIERAKNDVDQRITTINAKAGVNEKFITSTPAAVTAEVSAGMKKLREDPATPGTVDSLMDIQAEIDAIKAIAGTIDEASLLKAYNDAKKAYDDAVALGGGSSITPTGRAVVEFKQVSPKTVVARVLSEITNHDYTFKFPMWVNMNGAASGDAKVTLSTPGRNITPGTFVYAKVAETKIELGVEKVEKISRIGDNKVTLTLTEIEDGAFGKEGSVTLRLPVGFTWDRNGTSVVNSVDGAKVEFSLSDDERDITINRLPDADKKTDKIFINTRINVAKDARIGDVDVTVKKGTYVSPFSLVIAQNVTDSVTVSVNKVLDVIAGKDIDGKYRAEVYIEENVENALLLGRYMEFTLADGSLQDGQSIKLDSLKGTANLVIDRSSSDALVARTNLTRQANIYTSAAAQKNGNMKADKWELYVENASKDGTRSKYKLTIPFVVESDFTGDLILNVKGAGVVGDAKNGGVDVKIAEVKAPVTVKAEEPLAQVKIGLQDQMGSKIIVKETEAAALQDFIPGGTPYGSDSRATSYFVYYNTAKDIDTPPEQELYMIEDGRYVLVTKSEISTMSGSTDPKVYGTKLYSMLGRNITGELTSKLGRAGSYAMYTITSSKKDFGIKFTKAKVEVTGGNIILNGDKTDRSDKSIDIAVDRVSTEPSTIEISDVKLTLDRTVPYGDVKLNANFGVAGHRHDVTNKTLSFDYIKTLTPAPEKERVTTIFKIGQNGYTSIVGDVITNKEGDVAPSIKGDRTMLPIRQVAESLGLIVNWDAYTKTALFSDGEGNNVKVNLNSQEMDVNGAKVLLPRAPKEDLTNDRILLPVAHIAQAFGLQHGRDIVWEEATKTVVIYPQNPTQAEIDKAKEVAGL